MSPFKFMTTAYDKFIEERRAEYPSNEPVKGRQLHHVVPKCLGGGLGSNLVSLTPEDHTVAHFLLGIKLVHIGELDDHRNNSLIYNVVMRAGFDPVGNKYLSKIRFARTIQGKCVSMTVREVVNFMCVLIGLDPTDVKSRQRAFIMAYRAAACGKRPYGLDFAFDFG